MTFRLRTIAIAAATISLAATSASFALGRVTERKHPQISAALPTVNGIGLAERAELILASGMTSGPLPELQLGSVQKAQALALSRRAYAAEPLSVTAVRNIGLIRSADGETALARTIFRDAARLTRRDLTTNGWLIRDYGERNDVVAALSIYDRALSTSFAGQEMLLPVMLKALAQPELIAPLISLLRNDPPWAERFWREAPRHREALANVARIRVALAAEGRVGPEIDNRALLRALINAREFSVAEELYEAITSGPHLAGEILRNPSFEQPTGFEPFEWQLFFDAFLTADILPQDGTLQINTFADGSGVAARQLVGLTPGRYQLAITAAAWDELDSGALYARLRCADAGSDWKSDTVSVARARFAAEIAVGASACRYYWLELLAREQPQRRDNTIVLDSVRLRLLAAGD